MFSSSRRIVVRTGPLLRPSRNLSVKSPNEETNKHWSLPNCNKFWWKVDQITEGCLCRAKDPVAQRILLHMMAEHAADQSTALLVLDWSNVNGKLYDKNDQVKQLLQAYQRRVRETASSPLLIEMV